MKLWTKNFTIPRDYEGGGGGPGPLHRKRLWKRAFFFAYPPYFGLKQAATLNSSGWRFFIFHQRPQEIVENWDPGQAFLWIHLLLTCWQPVQTSEQTNDLVFEMDCKKVVLTSGLRLNYIVLCLTWWEPLLLETWSSNKHLKSFGFYSEFHLMPVFSLFALQLVQFLPLSLPVLPHKGRHQKYLSSGGRGGYRHYGQYTQYSGL